MIQHYDFKGVKMSVFGSLANINRATCTGLGCELARAATQASDGLFLAHIVPTFFPLSEDYCCFSVCFQGNACALISLVLGVAWMHLHSP